MQDETRPVQTPAVSPHMCVQCERVWRFGGVRSVVIIDHDADDVLASPKSERLSKGFRVNLIEFHETVIQIESVDPESALSLSSIPRMGTRASPWSELSPPLFNHRSTIYRWAALGTKTTSLPARNPATAVQSRI